MLGEGREQQVIIKSQTVMKTYIHINIWAEQVTYIYTHIHTHIHNHAYAHIHLCLKGREERERRNVMKTDLYNDLSLSINIVIFFQHNNTSYTVPKQTGLTSGELLEIK